MPEGTPPEVKGTCFVVMGFGKKTDFETGRTLDLDKTYKNIIKPAVEEAGLKCIRADEIVHSGLIDVPMYEQLLKADVVIADLSTSNKNAFYELGVRHALRPYTTIVICEDGVKTFPFDVNHILIRQYHHMGEGIDFEEVLRFRESPHGPSTSFWPGAAAQRQPRLHVSEQPHPARAGRGDAGRGGGRGAVGARRGRGTGDGAATRRPTAC